MKTYKVICINQNKAVITSKGFNPFNQIVFRKYANGLKEARELCRPATISYCRNAKCFTGYIPEKGIEYLVEEV